MSGFGSSPEKPAGRRGALGRGLESLLGEHMPESQRMVIGAGKGESELSITEIEPNPDQPRRVIEESELEDLAQSIRTRGVLQAILVRPGRQSGKYQIVAGERRWRAARKAGLTSIPAMVRPLDDLEVAEISIVENVQREDLNPIEEAQAYRQLIDKFGRTQEELSKQIGKSRSHIANVMRLLKLPESVQGKVREGHLSSGHARTILSASDPEALAEKVVEQKLSVRDTEAEVRAESRKRETATEVVLEGSQDSISGGDGLDSLRESGESAIVDEGVDTGIFDIRRGSFPEGSGISSSLEEDANIAALESSLRELTGLEFGVRRSGSGGEVWISYTNMRDLDSICRLLSSSVDQYRKTAG